MKLRNPRLIKAVGHVGSWVIRAWLATLRFRYQPLGPNFDPRRFDRSARRYIYTFWHETMLLPAFFYRDTGVCILISQHADGGLITEVAQRLGFEPVRGSTTRGGVKAVRRLLALGERCHLAITPDGPRGPRRQVQAGVIYLAARLAMPIVPAAFGFDRPWQANSWDRFALPRPGSRATCVTGQPIDVPKNTLRDRFESYRQLVQAQLTDLTDFAEQWALTGRLPRAAVRCRHSLVSGAEMSSAA